MTTNVGSPETKGIVFKENISTLLEKLRTSIKYGKNSKEAVEHYKIFYDMFAKPDAEFNSASHEKTAKPVSDFLEGHHAEKYDQALRVSRYFSKKRSLVINPKDFRIIQALKNPLGCILISQMMFEMDMNSNFQYNENGKNAYVSINGPRTIVQNSERVDNKNLNLSVMMIQDNVTYTRGKVRIPNIPESIAQAAIGKRLNQLINGGGYDDWDYEIINIEFTKLAGREFTWLIIQPESDVKLTPLLKNFQIRT